ncbi:transposase [Kitasatospora sp. NPDC089913]|uniref:transposase n=1 Tax=Kitasatospora sp. NPDC089913 TaxID=3364080 RepID=UPI0038051FCE
MFSDQEPPPFRINNDRTRPSALRRAPEEELRPGSPDLLRAMVKTFTESMMSANLDRACGRPGAVRINSRDRSRNRDLGTRVGTIDLTIPGDRSGTCHGAGVPRQKSAGSPERLCCPSQAASLHGQSTTASDIRAALSHCLGKVLAIWCIDRGGT